MNNPVDLFTLINEATQMFLDRSQLERDLIYCIAKMDDETRAALVLAYNSLKLEKEINLNED